jgi:hypothetical protein
VHNITPVSLPISFSNKTELYFKDTELKINGNAAASQQKTVDMITNLAKPEYMRVVVYFC